MPSRLAPRAATRPKGKRGGSEIYHQTTDEVGGRPYTGASFGLTYRIDDTWSVLFSAGPGLRNTAEGGRYSVYAALLLNL